MKIEIPLPSHCHFVVRWVFKQLFLFLSSASITKNQGFVPAGQTLILSKTSHHIITVTFSERKSTPSSNSLAFGENPKSGTKRKAVRFCVKKSLSMFQFFSFILLSFSLILRSSTAPGERLYSRSKAGRILEGVRLEWKRASGGR